MEPGTPDTIPDAAEATPRLRFLIAIGCLTIILVTLGLRTLDRSPASRSTENPRAIEARAESPDPTPAFQSVQTRMAPTPGKR